MKDKTRRTAGDRKSGGASREQRSASLDALREGLLDMAQAIAMLKTSRPTFYRWVREGKLKGLKVGRQWRFRREDVERFLKGEEPRIELPVDIAPLLGGLREQCVKAGGPEGVPAGTGAAAAVELMIVLGHRLGASDVHLEPVMAPTGGAKSVRVRCRVDGSLRTVAETDIRLLPALVERWKTLAACNVHEKERPQDGTVTLEVEGPAGKQSVRHNVCFLPTAMGESLVARILPGAEWLRTFDKMEFSPTDKARVTKALGLPYGLLVFSGPVGSGKSTVMYSCLGQMVQPQVKLFDIQDPIYLYLPGVQQVQVRANTNFDFPAAIKAVMRCDPDIIAVGEVRDTTTLKLTLDAALSGHLVLTQMHSDEAVRVLQQLVELGGDPFVVCETTKLVVGQRLVRKLCKECSVAKEPSAEMLAKVMELARAGGLAWEALPSPQQFRVPVGCAKCSGGFRGRTTVAETLEVTPALAAVLRRGSGIEELRALAIRQGMTTMVADGIRKAAAGITSLKEVLGVCMQA
ncbi:MAG: ATPase, T2SS/T4P/T4SS family [Planctomycetota bacterium]|nr:ATPase, T2SS/T4P/T4SS family [Planctomycetota bacterium]